MIQNFELRHTLTICITAVTNKFLKQMSKCDNSIVWFVLSSFSASFGDFKRFRQHTQCDIPLKKEVFFAR